MENNSAEYLINSLEGKTNDYLDSLMYKNFTIDQIEQFRVLRSQRDGRVAEIFSKFKKSLRIKKLLSELGELLEDNARGDRPVKANTQNKPYYAAEEDTKQS